VRLKSLCCGIDRNHHVPFCGSKGRIAVQTFAAGALVNEQDVAYPIQSRVVDISLSTAGVWASISPPQIHPPAGFNLVTVSSLRLTLSRDVAFTGKADLPVYVRVTQADGNQAWSSPIYLIDAP
jgi:hypothetical protein